MRSASKVIASMVLVVVALLTMSACGGSAHHSTRQGCKAAVVKAVLSSRNDVTELPECKGLSLEVKQSIAYELIDSQK